ncbi:MAG: MotA/TolQ/ExbB proton channel family protein [Planctomycetaceae bacterium]|nr:MotA/TolQ/ExbB proton channel family protein [Planctomycetaceae bacterium]
MKQKLLSNNPRMVPLLPSYIYGAGLAFLLFGLIRQGWVSHPMLDRYIMAHPVSLTETVMFSIGLTALAIKAWQLTLERRQLLAWQTLELSEESLVTSGEEAATTPSPASLAGLTPAVHPVAAKSAGDSHSSVSELADRYLNILAARPSAVHQSSIARRIREALQYIRTRQSTQDLDTQLKHLANREADAQHESYSLIRLMVWAIPMLGFLGTVLGISEALGGLNLGAGADLSGLINNLKSSLYVAFDTTALALSYGVLLMFIQFGLDRVESANVSRVDQLAEEFILENFQNTDVVAESPTRAISRMGQALLQATFSLVEHQHELWNDSLTSAQEAWIAATENSAAQSEALLQSAMAAAGQQIAERLTQALDSADVQLQNRAQQWHVAMSDNVGLLAKSQETAAVHIQLLERFFQQCSNLSEQQQSSISHLISTMDHMLVQNQEVQARWQEERTWQQSQQEQTQVEIESTLAAHATEVTRQRAMADARIAAEVEARMAAEQRAMAETEARLAAEGLVSAEAAARRMAEQQSKAANEALRRAEELARAATVARKLAERQLMLESENRQLKNSQEAAAQHRVASIPTPSILPFPTATVVIAASESPTVEVDAAIDVLPPVDWQAVPGGFQFSSDRSGDTSSAGPDSEQVNANVRSSILPFSDAKIYRAA